MPLKAGSLKVLYRDPVLLEFLGQWIPEDRETTKPLPISEKAVAEPVPSLGKVARLRRNRAGDEIPGTTPPDATSVPTIMAAGGEAPVQLCQLPWDQAWALVGRLAEAGIAAAVMEAEASARDVPMAERMVPVAVQPENLERARSFL